MATKNIEGCVFNNLTVLGFYDIMNKNSRWKCKCLLCGGTTIVSRPNILSGNTKDCGCNRSKKISNSVSKHNNIKSGTYSSWCKMKQRIKLGSKHSDIYGKIGIDEKWDDFINFYKDMGDRPSGYTLDRIDNSKGYFKENCRWATPKQQSRNRSSNKIIKCNGKSMCISEWAEYLGVHRSTVYRKIKKGLSLEV